MNRTSAVRWGLSALVACAASGWGGPDRAAEIVGEVAAAYQQAPALLDEISVEITSPRGRFTGNVLVAAGPGGDAVVEMDGYRFTAAGGSLFVQRQKLPDKYLEMPLRGNIAVAMRPFNGNRPPPTPQMILRYGRTLDDYLEAFTLGQVTGLRLAGHDTVERDGNRYDELAFEANGAGVKAWIKPDDRFIEGIQIRSGDSTITATMSPVRRDALPAPISFETDGLRRVGSFAELKLGAGDPAPDFALPALDGTTVKLSALRGSVVVLDFWATWCGPCKIGLKSLQQFDDWVSREGLDIKVFAVDSGERMPTNNQKLAAVDRYWKSQRYTMPTLMDYDETVGREYEIISIPHTVIVGPDGTIIEVMRGYRPGHLEHLKQVAANVAAPGSR